MEFESFFACADGATPLDLLRAGIYHEIAVPIKAGPWRKTSLVMLAQAMALSTQTEEGLPQERSNRIHLFGRRRRAEMAIVQRLASGEALEPPPTAETVYSPRILGPLSVTLRGINWRSRRTDLLSSPSAKAGFDFSISPRRMTGNNEHARARTVSMKV